MKKTARVKNSSSGGGSNILNILPVDLGEVTAEDFIMLEVKEMLLVLVDVMGGTVPGVVVVLLCSLLYRWTNRR